MQAEDGIRDVVGSRGLGDVYKRQRLGRARVVPVVTRMTAQGYEVQILPAWSAFPGPDPVADAATMNQRLQAYIDTMPDQYYWVHRLSLIHI